MLSGDLTPIRRWITTFRRVVGLTEKMLSLDPSFNVAFKHLAWSYALQGDFKTAYEQLERETQSRISEEIARPWLVALDGRAEEAALKMSEALDEPFKTILGAEFGMLASRWDSARRDRSSGQWRQGMVRGWMLRNRGDLYAYWGQFDSAVNSYRQGDDFLQVSNSTRASRAASRPLRSNLWRSCWPRKEN